MNWRRTHKTFVVLLHCCVMAAASTSQGLPTPRDEQKAQVKGPKAIASEVVIPQFKVNEASLGTIVEQINQAIGGNEHAAGQLSIKLNPNINQGIKITLTLEGVTVLSILERLKGVTLIPYIARGRDIWIGAPVVPTKKITEQEQIELRKKLRGLSNEALVDLFTETQYQGLASHSTATSYGFAALEIEPHFYEGVLGSVTPIVSPVMREIVTRGIVALPVLIEHLRDDRETLLIVGADGFFTSKWHSDEYDTRYRDPNRQPQGVNTVSWNDPSRRNVDYYVLKVGDICYEAIGQIVNRHLAPIRYQPTACLVINSPVETPALARAVREDWGSCTTNEYIQSLIQDAHDKYSFDAAMAIVRLCFYYPQTGEKVASDLLHRPLYDDDQLSYFIQNRLTKETDPAKWQSLIEAYVRTQGDAVREAIPFRLHWIYLETNRSKTEEFLSERNVAHRILDQLFPRFAPWGKTQVNAAEPCEQADLIHSLAFFKSDIIDKAVLELAKRAIILKLDKPQPRTTLMEACKQRLAGSKYEDEFRLLRWDTIKKSDLQAKMERLIIPQLEFRQANIADVIKYLNSVSVVIDKDSAPGEKGVSFILQLKRPGTAAETAPVAAANLPVVTLSLRNISMMDAIKYIMEVTGLKYQIQENAVVITPAK